MTPPDIFHVRVENSIRKFLDHSLIHALIAEVRRIVIETKTRMPLHGFERAFRRGDVEGDFRRMHFKREVDVLRSNTSRIGSQRLAKSANPLLRKSALGKARKT